MKKRILVIMTMALGIGGVERSLLGLLDAFDYSQYDVDLLLYAHHGELLEQINQNVRILPENKELSRYNESFASKIKNKCYYSAWVRIKQAIQKFDYVEFDKQIVDHCTSQLNDEYDVAICFFQPFNFLKTRVNAKIKIGWIHTDYSNAPCDINSLRKSYRSLDYIAAVSDACRDNFINIFPEYIKQTITIENILSKSIIEQQSLASSYDIEIDTDTDFQILSIGRFVPAKNFTNVPFICKRILEKGLRVKWYLIGYGPEEAAIKENIIKYNMENNVIILGKKTNPYPYIKKCDLYAQPSIFEGKAVTVCEAQMLNKPVVITAYSTAHSQVEDGVDGIIVPIDNEACAEGIASLLCNSELMKKLEYNCSIRDYSNSEEVKKIYKLM